MGVRYVTVVPSYLGALEERDPLEDLTVDRRIMVKWVFKRRDANAWIEFF
jgi:hypothetical protein